MGKRKKASKPPPGPKKREPLAKVFACLFCNHEDTVTVKLHKKEGVGQLECRICGQTYATDIHYLSDPVDVYSDWIDACDAVKDNPGGGQPVVRASGMDRRSSQPTQRVPRPQTGGGEEDDLDGFIENDEEDPDAQFTA